ncbi:hypothetical protein [Riemerella anatipestifer]|uniref:Uncharacterized protein n=1 Tax=Riemerella anatipestifer RA-CH-1 TaxID=1228997 RepID=J9R6Z9_RIEAN|nr:hypothetical protein [Riemerella anatipestifer]AFR36268.1 hypothetical protein B739_1677 [Riemerella anatipestifer RA-CH-1]MCO7331957.1 hypothetical protein [Riemerella anatipestifer]MCO7350844.1 hypothetical protein [Riemerella anatipestifer]MCU7582417.1 hypothetical protein [Riemerella anatipestifer]MCW0492520.1 hypothetical protein [Riemerella anatipestifer]
MKLPNDISRCANNNCLLKEQCLRWLDTGDRFGPLSLFKPKNGKCENLIHKQ